MRIAALITFFLFTATLAFSQTDTTEKVFLVKKPVVPNTTFTYKGKPVSPEALLSFIPGMQLDDTIRPWKVDLKDGSYIWTVDSIGANTFRTTIIYDSTSQLGEEHIYYEVIGKTAKGSFVLDVKHSDGGFLVSSYIFVFKIVEDELIKVALFDAVPAYLQPAKVTLMGNRILTGNYIYTIPE